MGLNIERLTILRDHIAALDPSRFNMAVWSQSDLDALSTATLYQMQHNCGTAACIGGWAETLFVAKEPTDFIGAGSDTLTIEALGITAEQAEELFFPHYQLSEAGLDASYSQLTQRQAVEVLDHLIETGQVDWPRAVRMHPNE